MLKVSKMVPNYLINIHISKISKYDISENKLCYLQSDVCIFCILPYHIELVVSETDPDRLLTSLH